MSVRSADPSVVLIVVVLTKLKQAISWLYPTRNSFAQDGGCDWKNHLLRFLPGRFGLMNPTRSLTLRHTLSNFGSRFEHAILASVEIIVLTRKAQDPSPTRRVKPRFF